jgi:hypothetical protein
MDSFVQLVCIVLYRAMSSPLAPSSPFRLSLHCERQLLSLIVLRDKDVHFAFSDPAIGASCNSFSHINSSLALNPSRTWSSHECRTPSTVLSLAGRIFLEDLHSEQTCRLLHRAAKAPVVYHLRTRRTALSSTIDGRVV